MSLYYSDRGYYAFGMPMPGRSFNNGNYRYGFNGKENDYEVKGEGNNVDFGARIYDARLGRWLSLDPLQAKYANLSPFNFCGNNPIAAIDPNGKEIIVVPTTVSCDGSNPPRLGELGNTTHSIKLQFNKITRAYDLILTNHIQYTRAFDNPGLNGKTLEQENPGLGLTVSTHEGIHVKENINAANVTYVLCTDIFGDGGRTYTGMADVIATQIYRDVNSYVNGTFSKAVDDIEKEYAPLLSSAKGDMRDKIEKIKNEKIAQVRNDIAKKGSEILNAALDQTLKLVELKMKELNFHDGSNGVNQQTIEALPEGDSIKIQMGELPTTWQGIELQN